MARPFWILVLVLAVVAGCKTPKRTCIPDEISMRRPVYDAAGSDEYCATDVSIVKALHFNLTTNLKKDPRKSRKISLIAFSGGGKFGAYSAGVVCGMSSAGIRPNFDVVTGVSTGCLVATLTFLGPEYEAHMMRLYTTLRTEDIIKKRKVLAVLTSASAFDSSPLAGLIDREVTDEMLAKVAAEHAKGRRLFVGTTNIDTRRIAIWDMGAIASSNRPDKASLFRKVLLASCSVPAGLPPVEIDVTFDGVPHKELHVDGGASSQLFVRANMLTFDPKVVEEGYRPFEGSEAYLVVAGKIYSDPGCTQRKLLSIAGSAATSMIYAATRSDLFRVYTLCLFGGANYNVIALNRDVAVNSDSLFFDPSELQLLFNEGFKDGSNPKRWRHTPPDAEAEDQIVPRVGTDFTFDPKGHDR